MEPIDDILWEILVRLPTKSLMRFKSVSKRWNAMIRDPVFVKSHIGGFRGLFLVHMGRSPENNISSSANIRLPGVSNFFIAEGYNTIQRNIPGCYQLWLENIYDYDLFYESTNIQNGLFVCYFHAVGSFTLCNIATHELLELPIKYAPELERYECYFGFEPVRGVYKLLRYFVAIPYREDPTGYFQICTIIGGEDKDLEWRSIGEPTGITHFYQNMCCNGILYLMGWLDLCSHNYALLSFDLAMETAQFIPLPGNIKTSQDKFRNVDELIQLDGSIGLMHVTHEVSTIWMLRDNKTWTKCYSVDCTGICRVSKDHDDITYVGTLPTGEVLLASRTVAKDNPSLTIYKYDHKRNKLLNWTELCSPFYNSVEREYLIGYHEDNIVPLDSLIINGSNNICQY